MVNYRFFTDLFITDMKFLFDFFPIALFFIAYKVHGIFVATAVAIIASFLQVGFYWLKHRKFENMHLVTLGLIAVFGGMTLAFQDETFIKWKFSLVSWLFGIVIFGSQLVGEKNIIERVMGANFELPKFIWRRANIALGTLMMAEGFANVFVLYNFDTDTWFNFKFYGMTAITIVFMLALSFYLARYIEDKAETQSAAQSEEE